MDLPGVGPIVAARVLADVGDVARSPTGTGSRPADQLTGTAPIEASSGEIVRHRLSRAGNRRMIHVIHNAATTQIRLNTPCRPTTGASSPLARPRQRRCAASSAGSPTPSTDS